MSSIKSSLVLVVIGLCVSLAFTQAYGQGVNSRAASPDQPRLNSDTGPAGSGAARNVYAQRQLSPHRMMHFGKRPLQVEPPTIMALDPNQVSRYLMAVPLNEQDLQQEVEIARQESKRERDSVARFPYSLYFDLPQNRVLEPVFEDPRLQMLMMINSMRQKAQLQEGGNQQLLQVQQQQQQQQKQKRRTMHVQSRALVDEVDGQRTNNLNSLLQDDEVAQVPPTRTMTQQHQRYGQLMDSEQQQQASTEKPQSSGEQAPNVQQENTSINLVNRSPAPQLMQPPPPMMLPFGELPPSSNSNSNNNPNDPYTKQQIFNYLYGRDLMTAAPPTTTSASFKRKGEPGRMTFMHFG